MLRPQRAKASIKGCRRVTLRKQNWIVLGRFAPPPDPLAEATGKLRTLRVGRFDLDAKRATEWLQQAGCASVHAAPRIGPFPLDLILGQKPVSS